MTVELIRPVKALHGHTTAETARVVDDYPYGRLRCQKRYWIETAAKGSARGRMRCVEQTTNPKRPGVVWNKPHPGQYSDLMWLYEVDNPAADDHGHVKHISVSMHVSPTHDARLRLMGVYDAMTDSERRRYDAMVNVSRTASPQTWDRWTARVTTVRAYVAEHGEIPEYTTRERADVSGRVLDEYITEWDWRVLATLAVQDAAGRVCGYLELTDDRYGHLVNPQCLCGGLHVAGYVAAASARVKYAHHRAEATAQRADGEPAARDQQEPAEQAVATRVTMQEARRHFEAGGSVLVSEYGDEPTYLVRPDSMTHNRDTTTWAELADQVATWRNRYPNQRYYIVPSPGAAAFARQVDRTDGELDAAVVAYRGDPTDADRERDELAAELAATFGA